MGNVLENTVNVRQFLTIMLENRKMQQPNGQPLYRYHLSQAEYLKLQHVLSLSSPQNQYLNVQWCGAFTLFAAEWFRREYSREWKWNPIYQKLGFNDGIPDIRRIVKKGLEEFWQRHVISFEQSQHQNFLGSVFQEGGFPSNLLTTSDNRYHNVFHSIVKQYGHYRLNNPNMIDALIDHYTQRLPEAFKHYETKLLIADMVENLSALVEKYQLDQTDKPAEYLEKCYPKWREVFPLPLENEIATQFLNQLLTTSSQEFREIKKKQEHLSCVHFFNYKEQIFQTEIFLPKVINIALIAGQEVKRRGDLVAYEIHKAIAELDSGTFNSRPQGSTAEFHISSGTYVIDRHQIDQDLRLVIQNRGQQIGFVELKQSAIELGEVPIAFIEDGNNYKFIGQASFRTPENEIILLVPNHYEILNAEECVTGHKGDLLKHKTYIVKGNIQLRHRSTDEHIEIQCSHLENDFIELQGEKFPWSTVPALTFVGRPKAVYLNDGMRTLNQQLRCYSGITPLDDLNGSAKYGVHNISVRNTKNHVVLRRKIAILPEDFKIKLVSGQSPQEGHIQILTKSSCVCLAIETKNTSLKFKLKKLNLQDHGVQGNEYNISVQDYPPTSIKMTLMVSTQPIVFHLPFPAQGAILYDADQLPFSRPQLTLSDLLGSRLHLFSGSEQPTNFFVEANLRTSTIRSADAPYYRWKFVVQPHCPIQEQLIKYKPEFEALLALSKQLDSRVQLTIRGMKQQLEYEISHYHVKFERDPSFSEFYSLSNVKLASLKDVEPMLMFLAQPEQALVPLEAVTSEGVHTGKYCLPKLDSNSGPWLIIPKAGSKVNFRPTYVFGSAPYEDTSLPPKTFHAAVRRYDPSKNPHTIRDFLPQLMQDLHHSGWIYILRLYSNYVHLPLVTFQIWHELTKNTDCLAQAIWLLKFNIRFLERFQREFGFIWESITFSDWKKAIHQSYQLYIDEGHEPDKAREKTHEYFLDLATVIPVLKRLEIYFLNNQLPDNYPPKMLQGLSSHYSGELIKRASEDEWPTVLDRELIQWYQQQTTLPILLTIHHAYQASVMILPIYMGMLALGKTQHLRTHSDVLNNQHIRQIREFDQEWFENIFSIITAYFLNDEGK
ncbi:STY4851/ECs_5259 family protein [Acinetobacter baumannii]